MSLALSTQLIVNEGRRRGFEFQVLLGYPLCVVRTMRDGVGFVFQHWPGFYRQTRRRDVSRLASKVRQKELLRAAGLPVPELYATVSAPLDEGETRAWPWPVVVKPAEGAGSQSVFCGVADRDSVARHASSILRQGSVALVEEQVHGDHVRILCVNGECVGGVHRRSPEVVGDGRHSVHELVEARNADPARRPVDDLTALVHPVVIDDELLAATGLSRQGIPAIGQAVTVNSRITGAVGADFIDVTDRLHPETVRLCEAFARRHELQIAGFDLITPDVTQSCRVLGAFNEVNVHNVHLAVVEVCNVGPGQPVSRHVWDGLPLDRILSDDFEPY